MTQLTHPVKRVWQRIREPRIQRVVYTIVYGTLSLVGVIVLMRPPQTVMGEIGHTLSIMWGLFLALAVVAAVAAIPGWWWLEKLGGISATVGIIIYAVITFMLHFSEPVGNRLPQGLVIAAFALLLGIRAYEIRGLDYEPRG